MPGGDLLINFNGFLDKYYIDVGGALIAAFVAVAVAFGLLRWRPTLRAHFAQGAAGVARPSRASAVAHTLVYDVIMQKPISDCSASRWAMHFSIFWGFIGLAVATTLDAVLNPLATPLPLSSPVRIVGNVGGVLFMAGVTLSIGRRAMVEDVRRNSGRGDVAFLAVLFATGLTGFATEYFSEFNLLMPDSVSFWVHMAFVAALLITAPFTKFVHSIGRPLLLFLKRKSGEGKTEGSG